MQNKYSFIVLIDGQLFPVRMHLCCSLERCLKNDVSWTIVPRPQGFILLLHLWCLKDNCSPCSNINVVPLGTMSQEKLINTVNLSCTLHNPGNTSSSSKKIIPFPFPHYRHLYKGRSQSKNSRYSTWYILNMN